MFNPKVLVPLLFTVFFAALSGEKVSEPVDDDFLFLTLGGFVHEHDDVWNKFIKPDSVLKPITFGGFDCGPRDGHFICDLEDSFQPVLGPHPPPEPAFIGPEPLNDDAWYKWDGLEVLEDGSAWRNETEYGIVPFLVDY